MDSTSLKIKSGADFKEYQIQVGINKICTIVTDNDGVVQKWLETVLESHKPGVIVAGFGVDRKDFSSSYLGEKKMFKDDNPLSTLQICIGANCIVYEVPQKNPGDESIKGKISKTIINLLKNPRFLLVGFEVADIRLKLETNYGVGLRNGVDILSLVEKEKSLPAGQLMGYGIDKIVELVVGKASRPSMMWPATNKKASFEGSCSRLNNGGLNPEKIRSLTVDTFLLFSVAAKLLVKEEETPASDKKGKKKIRNA